MAGQLKLEGRRGRCASVRAGWARRWRCIWPAAGVGTLGIVDFDDVDYSNLQRQILHGTPDVGRSKLDSARSRLNALNPEVEVVTHEMALSSQNALGLFADYDLVVDGTDNFPTRYLVNDACVIGGKPNVYGSIFRFEGQVSVFATKDGPCYRCMFPEPPPPGLVPSCAEGGVLGILPGVVGTLQATEAIKLILGAGESLVGRFLLFDALKMRFRELKVRKDPDCPVCGEHPHRDPAHPTMSSSAGSPRPRRRPPPRRGPRTRRRSRSCRPGSIGRSRSCCSMCASRRSSRSAAYRGRC